MRWLLGLMLAVLVPAGHSSPAAIAEIPFEFREGFLWLKVQTDRATAPLNFILDSGASVSVIDLPTSCRLKIKPGSPVNVQAVQASANGSWPACLNATSSGV